MGGAVMAAPAKAPSLAAELVAMAFGRPLIHQAILFRAAAEAESIRDVPTLPGEARDLPPSALEVASWDLDDDDPARCDVCDGWHFTECPYREAAR